MTKYVPPKFSKVLFQHISGFILVGIWFVLFILSDPKSMMAAVYFQMLMLSSIAIVLGVKFSYTDHKVEWLQKQLEKRNG